MDPSLHQDADYLAAITEGRRADLERMYRTLFPMVHKLVMEQGGSPDDAKDVFQDAVVLVFEKAQKPGFHLTSKFSTFFYGICRNIWWNQRHKKSGAEITIPDDAKYITDETDDADFIEAERGRVFSRAFRQLSEECRNLLQLYFQKKPMEQIAAQMAYASEGYARLRKFQCKDRLTELVKADPTYRELRNDR